MSKLLPRKGELDSLEGETQSEVPLIGTSLANRLNTSSANNIFFTFSYSSLRSYASVLQFSSGQGETDLFYAVRKASVLSQNSSLSSNKKPVKQWHAYPIKLSLNYQEINIHILRKNHLTAKQLSIVY